MGGRGRSNEMHWEAQHLTLEEAKQVSVTPPVPRLLSALDLAPFGAQPS